VIGRKINDVKGSGAESEQLNGTSLIYLLRFLPQGKGDRLKCFKSMT